MSSDQLITTIIRVLQRIDSKKRGKRPCKILKALDLVGYKFHADRSPTDRQRLLNRRLWQEVYETVGPRLQHLERGRYAILAVHAQENPKPDFQANGAGVDRDADTRVLRPDTRRSAA